MGGEKCWRCGLRRLETDERCFGCGATFGRAAAATRRRVNAGTPRIPLGVGAVLATREPVAPPGHLFNIARFHLGAASGFVLLFWAYAVLLISLYFAAPLILVYTAPFVLYPAAALYCCLRVLPARKVAVIGLVAHLGPLLCALLGYAIYGGQEGGSPRGGASFGWVVALSFVAAWAALYVGRLMDEGRLRADAETQTILGIALIVITVLALVWSHMSDRRARDTELDWQTQRWSEQR